MYASTIIRSDEIQIDNFLNKQREFIDQINKINN